MYLQHSLTFLSIMYFSFAHQLSFSLLLYSSLDRNVLLLCCCLRDHTSPCFFVVVFTPREIKVQCRCINKRVSTSKGLNQIDLFYGCERTNHWKRNGNTFIEKQTSRIIRDSIEKKSFMGIYNVQFITYIYSFVSIY